MDQHELVREARRQGQVVDHPYQCYVRRRADGRRRRDYTATAGGLPDFS
jgi:hypothetical protein